MKSYATEVYLDISNLTLDFLEHLPNVLVMYACLFETFFYTSRLFSLPHEHILN